MAQKYLITLDFLHDCKASDIIVDDGHTLQNSAKEGHEEERWYIFRAKRGKRWGAKLTESRLHRKSLIQSQSPIVKHAADTASSGRGLSINSLRKFSLVPLSLWCQGGSLSRTWPCKYRVAASSSTASLLALVCVSASAHLKRTNNHSLP